MKNKLFTDRKVLAMFLGVIMVSILTLTLAYAALSVTLNIQGNARVSAADWDIYLNNPRVASGSATTNLPEIKTSNTLEFETTLNMPGDFYEFTVDVVNNGSIDAMIENVVKNPELTAEQAKYLKYEVSYQNGESIATKQTLPKKSTMPIKVRIEYRKNLNASDLPAEQVVLDLSLTLEYIQSDGTGSSVNNNGVQVVFANDDINEIGTIVTIGSEQFYTIGTDGDNVKLLAMYNLHVGNSVTDWVVTPLENPTGMQDLNTRGWVNELLVWYGGTAFSSDTQKGTNYSDYNGSIVEGYVNNYKNILESNFGVKIEEARLITKEELTSSDIGCSENNHTCVNAPSFIYLTSYWSGSASSIDHIWGIDSSGTFSSNARYNDDIGSGVRPVIVISKDYF